MNARVVQDSAEKKLAPEQPAVKPPPRLPDATLRRKVVPTVTPSNPFGVRIAIAAIFILSIVALGSAGLVYQSLHYEKSQRQSMGSQFQAKASQLETEIAQY